MIGSPQGPRVASTPPPPSSSSHYERQKQQFYQMATPSPSPGGGALPAFMAEIQLHELSGVPQDNAVVFVRCRYDDSFDPIDESPLAEVVQRAAKWTYTFRFKVRLPQQIVLSARQQKARNANEYRRLGGIVLDLERFVATPGPARVSVLLNEAPSDVRLDATVCLTPLGPVRPAPTLQTPSQPQPAAASTPVPAAASTPVPAAASTPVPSAQSPLRPRALDYKGTESSVERRQAQRSSPRPTAAATGSPRSAGSSESSGLLATLANELCTARTDEQRTRAVGQLGAALHTSSQLRAFAVHADAIAALIAATDSHNAELKDKAAAVVLALSKDRECALKLSSADCAKSMIVLLASPQTRLREFADQTLSNIWASERGARTSPAIAAPAPAPVSAHTSEAAAPTPFRTLAEAALESPPISEGPRTNGSPKRSHSSPSLPKAALSSSLSSSPPVPAVQRVESMDAERARQSSAAELARLRDQIAQYRAQIDEKDGRIAAFDRDLVAERDAAAKLRDQLSHCRALVDDKESKIVALGRDVERANERAEAAQELGQKGLAEADEARRRAIAERDSAMQQLSQQAGAQDAVDAVARELADKNAALAAALSKLGDTEVALEAARAQASEQTQIASVAQNQLGEQAVAMAELDRLKELLKEKEAELAQVDHGLANELARAAAERDELRETLKAKEEELYQEQVGKTHIESVVKQLRAAQEESARKTAEVEKLAQVCGRLQAKLEAADAARERAKELQDREEALVRNIAKLMRSEEAKDKKIEALTDKATAVAPAPANDMLTLGVVGVGMALVGLASAFGWQAAMGN